MEVIPYFLPDEAAPAGTAPEVDEGKYFLYVGRLEKIKGVQDILPAFAGERGPKLLVIGTGEYEAELKRHAGDKPRVKFLGRLAVDALARYYRGAIALIVPTLGYETFGIILIEAFRHGTPVIARRIGPFPEVLRSGGGELFSSMEELAAVLERFERDENLRSRLAREARASFESHWREDVVIDAYLDLLRKTARAKGDARVVAALES
jgi:glycosyltransferase involved in cell wall biosynthesis